MQMLYNFEIQIILLFVTLKFHVSDLAQVVSSQTKVSVPYINNMLQYVSDKPARYNSPTYYGHGNTRMQLATMR